MRCHAPDEDVEEDDRQFLAAARVDATLVAHLLLRLSRSEACSSPWRQLRDPASSPSAGAEDDLPLPDPPKWGQRRPRSRCLATDGILAEKREEVRRSSPTTPLSWSGGGGGGGGSWTSGSVSESTPPHRPPKRRKEPDSSFRHDVVQPSSPSVPAKAPNPEPHEDWRGHGPDPPCKWKRTEATCKGGSPSGTHAAAAPAAVESASFPGSTKAVTAAEEMPPRAAAHVEPLRLRWTGEGTSSVAVRRPGKKKTVPELKALNESLLQEQVELRKDLEEQKKIFEALLEENFRLKNLEASLGIFHKVGEPTVLNPAARRESESEDPGQHQDVKESSTAAAHPDQQLLQCRPPTPRRAPLFDLNCLPDDGDLL